MTDFATLPVTLRQLQYFVAVVDSGSFSKAALLCGVSQPSLSAAILQAEDALGLTVLDRSTRPVGTTPGGTLVLDRARAVLLASGDLLATARSQRNPLHGTLRLGVIPTIAPYALPAITLTLRAMLPELQVVWLEDRTPSIVAQLEGGQLDAALLALEADLGELTSVPVGWDPFVVAMAPADYRAELESVSAASLEAGPLLLLQDGHCLSDQTLQWCARQGTGGSAGLRATSLATLTQMVASGAGVTLLPRLALAVENRAQQLTLKPLQGPQPGRTLGLAWRRNQPLALALNQLGSVMQMALQPLLDPVPA
jgi:LysR family hydrogen peroxide-inducible transcriptional activator